MATVINDREEEANLEDGEELHNFSDSQEEPEEIEEVSEPEEEENLPEKYRNKSVKDIIAMHQNAEQLLGKQGQEVGQLRKIVDDFIQSQTVSAHAAQEDIDEDDFFTNPKEAVTKLLETHPSIRKTQELAAQLKQQETVSRLKAAHPDFLTIVQNQNFLDWVGKSNVRTKLLQEADKNYDFDSADELLSLWKERQETVNSTIKAEKANRKEQVKSASAGTSQGSGERPSRKIYRRADIIELMRKDPQRYEDLMPEIRQAYAEGRVK